MVNETLRQYIKRMLKEGSSEEQIVEALKEDGWSEEQVKIEIVKSKREEERKNNPESEHESEEKKCLSYFKAFLLVVLTAAVYWIVDNFELVKDIATDVLLVR